MDNCIHSAVAPNMNRCIVCGMIWSGERWESAPTEAGAGKSEKVRRIGKPGDGEYEYRGVNVWRNFGTPAGYYAAWLARMGGKNVSFCTRREACDAIDARAKATGAQP